MPDVTTRTPPVTDGQREARCVTFTDIEVRETDGGGITVSGYAAVYDSPSEDLGGFIEELKQGAFRKVLRSRPDVRFLVNHEGVPFGRTVAGTLRLKDEPKGLKNECDFPDTQAARDLATSIKRGDINQMSFMFRVEPEGREWFFPDDPDELARRVIYEISELYDVSIVTFPAYPATEIGVRGMIAGEAIATPEGQLDEARFVDVSERVHAGDLEASAAERRELDRAADRLDTVTPWQRERALRTAEAPVEPVAEESAASEERAEPEAEVAEEAPAEERDAEDFGLEVRRRRLALAEDFQPQG